MNIQTALKKIRQLAPESCVIAECDLLKIVVHKPEFGTFFNIQVQDAGFSGKKPVFALMGRLEKVADINNRHIIAMSENLEKMVEELTEGNHPLDDRGMFGKTLSAFIVK